MAAASAAGVTIDPQRRLPAHPAGWLLPGHPSGVATAPGHGPSAGPLAVLRPLVLPALLPLLEPGISVAQLASRLNSAERTTRLVPEIAATRVVTAAG